MRGLSYPRLPLEPIILILMLAVAPALASEAPSLSVEAAVGESLGGNPGLAEMRARAEAAAAIPSQVGTMPDPSISFRALNLPVNSFRTTQEAMTQLQFGISQLVPYPGKLALRESSARSRAMAAGAEVDEFRLRLARDVKTAWWEIFYLDRAIETVKRNQELLRGLIDIAETKYRVGQGLQQDVLLANLELSKLLDNEVALNGARNVMEARLNALLDRSTDGAVILPGTVKLAPRKPQDEAKLLAQAGGSRPLIAAERHLVKAAEANYRLAKKDYYPDFNLQAAYGIRGGHDPFRLTSRADFLTLGVSVAVPIRPGRRQAKAVEQRRAEQRQRQLALDDALRRVEAEVSGALANFERAGEQAMLLKGGIIPQARQTLESMRAGYLVNKVDFLNLVGAQLSLNDNETRYWRAVSETEQAFAALIAALGGEMTNE